MFLVLAAQFESFINPLVILVTVPLAITGAMLGLWFYGSSINVFSQIGAILLIGLFSSESAGPSELNRHDRMRSITIESGMAEGVFRNRLKTSSAFSGKPCW